MNEELRSPEEQQCEKLCAITPILSTPIKTTGGRRKIAIEFIEDKNRRQICFSKRKAGIMKKVHELSTLTGTQALLIVASESGQVYTFATPKLQPIVREPEGKYLIQSCLNVHNSPPEINNNEHSNQSQSTYGFHDEDNTKIPISKTQQNNGGDVKNTPQDYAGNAEFEPLYPPSYIKMPQINNQSNHSLTALSIQSSLSNLPSHNRFAHPYPRQSIGPSFLSSNHDILFSTPFANLPILPHRNANIQ